MLVIFLPPLNIKTNGKVNLNISVLDINFLTVLSFLEGICAGLLQQLSDFGFEQTLLVCVFLDFTAHAEFYSLTASVIYEFNFLEFPYYWCNSEIKISYLFYIGFSERFHFGK